MTRNRSTTTKVGARVGWLCAMVMLCSVVQADEPRVFATAGVDFRTGDFGRSRGDTRIWAIPLALEYRVPARANSRDRIRVRVSLPLLSIDGPDRGTTVNASSDDRDMGLGDLALRVGYLWVPDDGRWPAAELSGRVKIPTASESRDLGTGEFDWSAALRLSKTMRAEWLGGRRITPFVRGEYKLVGEPNGEDRDDVGRASFGASVRWSARYSAGLRYSWRQSAIGRQDRSALTAFGSWRASRQLRVAPYLSFGISSQAPDWGAGFTLRYEIGRP